MNTFPFQGHVLVTVGNEEVCLPKRTGSALKITVWWRKHNAPRLLANNITTVNCPYFSEMKIGDQSGRANCPKSKSI